MAFCLQVCRADYECFYNFIQVALAVVVADAAAVAAAFIVVVNKKKM
jgi:hypothetical protein